MAGRTLRRTPARAPAGPQAQSLTTATIVSLVIAALHNTTIGMTNHVEHARPRTARISLDPSFSFRSGCVTHRDSGFTRWPRLLTGAIR